MHIPIEPTDQCNLLSIASNKASFLNLLSDVWSKRTGTSELNMFNNNIFEVGSILKGEARVSEIVQLFHLSAR